MPGFVPTARTGLPKGTSDLLVTEAGGRPCPHVTQRLTWLCAPCLLPGGPSAPGRLLPSGSHSCHLPLCFSRCPFPPREIPMTSMASTSAHPALTYTLPARLRLGIRGRFQSLNATEVKCGPLPHSPPLRPGARTLQMVHDAALAEACKGWQVPSCHPAPTVIHPVTRPFALPPNKNVHRAL